MAISKERMEPLLDAQFAKHRLILVPNCKIATRESPLCPVSRAGLPDTWVLGSLLHLDCHGACRIPSMMVHLCTQVYGGLGWKR